MKKRYNKALSADELAAIPDEGKHLGSGLSLPHCRVGLYLVDVVV